LKRSRSTVIIETHHRSHNARALRPSREAQPATGPTITENTAMALPKEFFTPESMLTLAGAAGATFVVCNGLQKAFDFNPRWLGLAIAQLIVLAGTAATGPAGVPDYLVGVINGFLVFLTAAGGTSAGSGGAAGQPIARGAAERGAPAPSAGRRGFLTPWF
jgi:hypothetical protein